MSRNWITLDEARDRCGAPDHLLSEALKSGRVGITAVIKAGRRDWLQHLWMKADLDDFNDREPRPSRIDDLLSSRATSITFGKNNYIEVALSDQSIKEMVDAAHQFAATGQQISPMYESFRFGEVRVHEPSLLEELAALERVGKLDPDTEKQKQQLVEWMKDEKRKHGKYPKLEFDKSGLMTVRQKGQPNRSIAKGRRRGG